MKANATDLFEGRKHYEIPAFQRPYVWNEEYQWAPLWDDVVHLCESHIIEGAKPISSHFLGAVVFESGQAASTNINRHEVIDGQQRLTTLQLLLDAVQEILARRGHGEQALRLEELILNSQTTYEGTAERFKLWPSQADRSAFANAMDPSEKAPDAEHQITKAHAFFKGEAERWLAGDPDDEGQIPPGDEGTRAAELCESLAARLMVVAIDLSGDDDAQLIFETLNDRGTPLLKADLIKNWVFRRGEKVGANVEKWARTVWDDFDTEWWREEISQGRLARSRVDIFLQYWLTMRLLDEVKGELVFRVFVEYADKRMEDAESADELLRQLRRDADTYRGLGGLDVATPEGRFRSRVIETMELAATTPIFLWLLSENHAVPRAQRWVGLESMESWVVRRTLLQLTSKDVNKFIVAILKSLAGVAPDVAGESIRQYLSEQTATTRIWPNDEELISELPGRRMYGTVRRNRVQVVLGAVEQYLRKSSQKYEATTLPERLEIEHVMPQGWRTYWDSPEKLSLEDSYVRDRAVNTIGNLTLVTKSLNGSLSNRPWTDSEAAGLSDGGEPDTGKRALLNAFSLLVLNKEIVDGHAKEWTEADILSRSKDIAVSIAAIWPGPDPLFRLAALERVRGDG